MRPSREENLMQHALVAAERSSCSRGHVGCVFAKEGRILVTGYNGAPRGMLHCDHICDCGVTDMSIKREHDTWCQSLAACTISVHAEANAIAFAAKHGVCLDGSELYATYSPCVPCAQLIINVGVVKAYAFKEYRVRDGLVLMERAGIQVIDWQNRD